MSSLEKVRITNTTVDNEIVHWKTKHMRIRTHTFRNERIEKENRK